MSNFKTHRLCSIVALLSLSLYAISPAQVRAADTAAPVPATPAAAPTAAAPDPVAAAPAPVAAAPAAAPAPVAAAPAAAPAPVAAAPVVAAPAATPAILGSYDISGVNAVDKQSYEGVAIITKKGEAYQVAYEDSESKYVGVGIPMGNVFGIAFSSENKPTISLMEPDGTTGWKAQFIERGESFISKETWKRR